MKKRVIKIIHTIIYISMIIILLNINSYANTEDKKEVKPDDVVYEIHTEAKPYYDLSNEKVTVSQTDIVKEEEIRNNEEKVKEELKSRNNKIVLLSTTSMLITIAAVQYQRKKNKKENRKQEESQKRTKNTENKKRIIKNRNIRKK